MKVFPHENPVLKVASLKNVIISASKDKKIRFWNESDVELLKIIEAHQLSITGLDVNQDNNKCCSGSRDNTIKIWDIQTGIQLLSQTISRNIISHLKWFPNANLILQTSEDRTVRIWDSRSLEVVGISAEKKHAQTHCDINVINNNYFLTSGSGGNGDGCEISLWDMRFLKIINEYRGHEERVNSCSFFSPLNDRINYSSQQIVSISNDQTIKVWNQISKELLTCLLVNGTSLNDLQDFTDESLGVATTSNGIQRFLRGNTFDGKYILRSISSF
ncbi:hypothetical protein CHUAL_006042 [Chamberlinius hualienensis]